MSMKFTAAALLSALLAFAAGCSNNTPSEPAPTDTTNLTDEFGGYSATAEAPAFGDSELLASEAEEEVVEDAMEAAPEVATLVDDPEAGVYRFRVVWGQLKYDSTHIDPTDWTGSLTASRGALLIRRLICFELNQDGYLPRTQPELVEWFSTTTTHHDGIEVEFFVPAAFTVDTAVVYDSLGDSSFVYDTIPADPVTLSFATEPYSRTFTLDELVTLDTIVTLADGNALLFQAMYAPAACRHGLVMGHWGYDENGEGVFQGRWMGARGTGAGWVRGHFGVDENGQQMFYGKWIDRSGQFEGFIRGTWESMVNDNASDVAKMRAGGRIDGSILDADGNEIGVFRGRYKSAPNWPDGWFQARWKLHCVDPMLSNFFDDF